MCHGAADLFASSGEYAIADCLDPAAAPTKANPKSRTRTECGERKIANNAPEILREKCVNERPKSATDTRPSVDAYHCNHAASKRLNIHASCIMRRWRGWKKVLAACGIILATINPPPLLSARANTVEQARCEEFCQQPGSPYDPGF